MTTATLPMFPLELVAFPGELLALHIFEDRYQELVRDCEFSNITFGIPTYINNTMRYGTEMELVEVVKRYPSGASDILCTGKRAFELQDFYNTLGDKLYAGGEVRFLKEDPEVYAHNRNKFIYLLSEFYNELDIPTPTIDKTSVTSFTYSHKIGLTLEQEYELLQQTSEDERCVFLIEHLTMALSTLKSVNRTKEIIKLNGHFKNFDPLDFKDYNHNN